MPLGSQLFRKVTIVGVGLMGGSLGLAIKKHKLAREVVGLSQRHASLVAALKNQAVDQAYHDVSKAVIYADLVILATPVNVILGMLSMIGPYLRRHCIVTDVGSTKTSIVNAAHNHLPPYVHFVGSHPLVGSEKIGVQHAAAELFENSTCIITPNEKTDRSACERVKIFWKRLGAQTKTLTPEEHDRILAYISHLPHLLAFALMETIPENTLEYTTQGLKDTTRIASSSPQMWNDICLSNTRNIVKSLDELVKNLSALRKSVNIRDHKTLMDHFKIAKTKRDKIV